jgi:hypothetical protein
MEVITSLISHLMNDADVTAVFGRRITGDRIPDSPSYPCARLRLITSPLSHSHSGNHTRTALVQIDVYSDSESDVDTGKEVIHDSLDGYRGMMGSMDIGYCFVNYGAGQYDETLRRYWRILEARIATND